MTYKSFASGYLIKDGKVLLAHSKKYNNWIPPGGHIEENETPEQTVIREFLEETGIKVDVISAIKNGLPGDSGRTPIAIPFHMGLYREDFDVPHIGYFYFVKALDLNYKIEHQKEEHFGVQWFSPYEVQNLSTYQQVKNECNYVFENYPF